MAFVTSLIEPQGCRVNALVGLNRDDSLSLHSAGKTIPAPSKSELRGRRRRSC